MVQFVAIIPDWRPWSTYLTVNSMAADDLVVQGAKASAAMLLTCQ